MCASTCSNSIILYIHYCVTRYMVYGHVIGYIVAGYFSGMFQKKNERNFAVREMKHVQVLLITDLILALLHR